MSENKKPLKKIRAGAISATIWENEVKKDDKSFVNHSITVERSYTVKENDADVWKTTSSMRLQDLPKVALVCDKAYEYIVLKAEESAENE